MACISVIIPVYKVELYLERCVQSIVKQTYTNLEIILVDDGSPDNCPAMCDSWAERDSRIKVIHKENGGLSDARNAGMVIAEGKYISFIDSDDWIAPEMLERLHDALEKDKSDIAACTVEMVWEDKTPEKLLTVQENRVLGRQEAQEALLLETKLKQPVWYKLYKREVLEGILFEKGKQHEDVFWSYQVIGNAAQVSLIDYIGYYYWQRQNSIMGESYSLKHLDAIEAYCDRYEYIKKQFPTLESKARVRILAACIYQGQMALLYLSKQERTEAFSVLEEVKEKYPIQRSDLNGMKTTHKLWLQIGKHSLKSVCRVKNVLKVGF